MIQTGDLVTFSCLHADGNWYRRWRSTVEAISKTCIVTVDHAGAPYDDVKRGRRTLEHAMRSYYWTDRFFNLSEVFDANGNPIEIYINIASPLQAAGDELHYVDHELDVVKYPGQPAQIIDQDEFEEAIALYGYSPKFQAQCWQAAEEARLFADAWMA
jgi:protein associated with RNAse G/E